MNTIEKAIEQIKIDISSGDVSAIYELLENVPEQALMAFLPEYGALWENDSIVIDDISHINE